MVLRVLAHTKKKKKPMKYGYSIVIRRGCWVNPTTLCLQEIRAINKLSKEKHDFTSYSTSFYFIRDEHQLFLLCSDFSLTDQQGQQKGPYLIIDQKSRSSPNQEGRRSYQRSQRNIIGTVEICWCCDLFLSTTK